MKLIAALALLLAAAGCSSADAPGSFTTPAPEADAGNDVIATPTPGTDSAPKVDAGGQAADAGHEADAAPAAIDSGSKVDAGTSPEATPPTVDAGPVGNDAAPPRVDAGNDAAPRSDAAAADVDGGNALACPGPASQCDGVNRVEQLIRTQYAKPCTEADRKCGGISVDNIVEVLPLVCTNGAWRLAGVWVGTTASGYWSPYYECSTGCDVGKLCTP